MIRLSRQMFSKSKITDIVSDIIPHIPHPVSKQIKNVIFRHAILKDDIILLKYLHQDIGLTKKEALDMEISRDESFKSIKILQYCNESIGLIGNNKLISISFNDAISNRNMEIIKYIHDNYHNHEDKCYLSSCLYIGRWSSMSVEKYFYYLLITSEDIVDNLRFEIFEYLCSNYRIYEKEMLRFLQMIPNDKKYEKVITFANQYIEKLSK